MKTSIKFIALFACLLIASAAQAQHQISGRIIDAQKEEPLEFANIVLSTRDSVYVTGTSCNQKGVFQLKNIAPGDYYLTVSYLGYTPGNIALNGFSKSVDLGDFFIDEANSELQEVTVTASGVTSKADRLIVFVTDKQKLNSSNGINILNTMQLPYITVNPITNEISLPGGGSVQFCINGMKVESSDIRALQPGDIIRVEYLDNPGLRYGDAEAVINYILKREVAGGSVSVDLGNAVTTSFGDDQISAKVNYKKSEFGANYALRYRNPTEVWTDQERTFNFADGSSMKRIDKGLPGDMAENFHFFTFYYNLLEDDKYYFNATVRHTILEDERRNRTNQYLAGKPDDITSVLQGANSHQYLPAVDLYYSRTLRNKQMLIFNVVGTYIKSELDQKYEETKDNELITDIVSDVDGKKYSLIGEGIYEKTFENNNRFSVGLKHTQSIADNEYTGTVTSTTEMKQSDTYAYAEYAGKINKFSYIGGVGLSRSWAKQEGQDSYSYYTFRPKATLQYDIAPGMLLRWKGEIFNTSPSLSNLSAVDQYQDTLQIVRGNPGLKPNVNYLTDILFRWQKNIYTINFNTSYHYSPKAIMESTYRENDKFISTYENQKNWQMLDSELTVNAGPIKNFLYVSLTGCYNRFVSNGNNYRHTLDNFYFSAQVTAMYKKFMAIIQARTPFDRLRGESINGGEKIHLFMVMYNAGKFSVGAGMMLPFSSQYKREGFSRNEYAPMKMNMYANDFSRMVQLKFAWNFNYGRKGKNANKRFNNQDTDAGIMRAN